MGIADVFRARQFIAEAHGATGSGRNWEIRRWEGMFWHEDPEEVAAMLAEPREDIRLWETEGGELVGVAHPEDGGDVHLQVRPGYEWLEDEMYAWAETVLPVDTEDGSRRLTAFALSDDEQRRKLLMERGYEREDWSLLQRWRSMDVPLPEVPVADGFTIRAIERGSTEDATRLADVINAAFGHSFGPEALLNFEHAPSFNAELQIVAEAPDGTFAAHAGVNLDTYNMLAIVEPVCTHPDHRRMGLASACMAEGLRRARDLGATTATVGTGDDNASNRIYEGLGFTKVEIVEAWTRTWPHRAIDERVG